MVELSINNIAFRAKTVKNKTVLKNAVSLAGASIAATNLILSQQQDKFEKSEDNVPVKQKISRADINKRQAKKASRIKNVITRAINKNETRTLEEISKRTKIPLNQVITIIYRPSGKEIRELYDKIKNITYTRKPVSDSLMETIEKMVVSAAKYKTTTEEVIQPENDYVKALASDIQQVMTSKKLSKEALNVFIEHYKEAPAFADTLVSIKDKYNCHRYIGPKSMNNIFMAYRLNTDLTESLITEYDEKGCFKYSIKDIPKIIFVSSFFPELFELVKEDTLNVYTLFAAKDKNGNRRFWANEIEQLHEYLIKYPKITQKLIQEKIVIEKFNSDYREVKKDIERACEAEAKGGHKSRRKESYKVNNESDNSEKKEKCFAEHDFKYSGEEILYLLKEYESSPMLVEFLINNHSIGYIKEILDEKNEVTKDNKYWAFNDFNNENELKSKGLSSSRISLLKKEYYDNKKNVGVEYTVWLDNY